MTDTRYKSGFTLVELLVALIVTSIVLTAVATLAFALGTANDSADDTTAKQAQVRYTTLKISQLIRHCKLICSAGSDDFSIWRADDNGDGQININELVYIETGPNKDHLQLCDFSSSDDSAINLGSIQALATNWWAPYCSQISYTPLIPQCSSVEFAFDVLPPQSRFVNISFNVLEDGVPRQFQISTALRAWAGHLLDASSNIVSDDD